MGYHTEFIGQFEFNQPLIEEHRLYLQKFNQTRRMKRDDFAELLNDPIREEVDLPIGDEGQYFVGGTGDYGKDNDESVTNNNDPPKGQPGLWCQWTPNEDGSVLEWDGGEKFYHYVDWIEYLIKNFIGPWGYKLNGEVEWKGEELDDLGIITIKDNVIDVQGMI